MTTPPSAAARTFYYADDVFYSPNADDTWSAWRCEVVDAMTAQALPTNIKRVELFGLGAASPHQVAAQHRREIEIARDMAAAQERTGVTARVTAAERRAEGAERRADARVEHAVRIAQIERDELIEARKAWSARVNRFAVVAETIGVVWGDETGRALSDRLVEHTGWDGEPDERYPDPEMLDITLTFLEETVERDHPSVAYPAPSDGTAGWAAAKLRGLIGRGYDIAPAVRELLAQLAQGEHRKAM